MQWTLKKFRTTTRRSWQSGEPALKRSCTWARRAVQVEGTRRGLPQGFFFFFFLFSQQHDVHTPKTMWISLPRVGVRIASCWADPVFAGQLDRDSQGFGGSACFDFQSAHESASCTLATPKEDVWARIESSSKEFNKSVQTDTEAVRGRFVHLSFFVLSP